MLMRARDLLKPAETVTPDTRINDALKLMSRKRLRELCIVDEGRFLGMVITRTLVDSSVDTSMVVSDFAFVPPVIRPNQDYLEIANEMAETRLETLPVVDKLKFLGVVTSNEILEHAVLPGVVSDLMVDAISVNKNDPVKKAYSLMRINNINRLPVMDGDELVGIITSSDIARRIFLAKHKFISANSLKSKVKGLDKKVSSVMTSPVITVSPSTPLSEAVKIFLEYDLRALPVSTKNNLGGIICRVDLLRSIVPKTAGIPVFLSGIEEEDERVVAAIERFIKKWLTRLAECVDFKRIDISLKRRSGPLFKVILKAGEHKISLKGDDVLITIKRAFKGLEKELI